MILAIHGFLGLPSDWNPFQLNGININDFPITTLSDWAYAFNSFIQKNYHKPILLGYSLGGRLALHALIQNPSLYHSGIIISSHPGLTTPQEKLKRLQNDSTWANRFLTEDWDLLMSAWNNQDMFSRTCIKRNENDFNRKNLANTLLNLSLSKQEDLRNAIRLLPLPLLWITGQQDHKFTQLASTLQFNHPSSKTLTIPNSSHRIPWDQPDLFKEVIRRQLSPKTPARGAV